MNSGTGDAAGKLNQAGLRLVVVVGIQTRRSRNQIIARLIRFHKETKKP